MDYGIALALASALFWGISYTISSKIVALSDPLSIAPIVNLLRFIWLCILAYAVRGSIKPSVAQPYVYGLILADALASAAAILCINYSIQRIGVSKAASIEISYPLFVMLFTSMLFGTQVTPTTIIGSIIVVIGISLIITGH